MTIPIFLSEAIPLEIRNILKSLEIGMPVRFRSDEGSISFICNDYITICVRKIPDETYRNKEREVNVICRACDWDELEICLLYTSPSPRDATLSRMPSSA